MSGTSEIYERNVAPFVFTSSQKNSKSSNRSEKAIKSDQKKNKIQDISAINDPLGKTHILIRSNHYSHLIFVLLVFEKYVDGCTDKTSEYSDHYRP